MPSYGTVDAEYAGRLATCPPDRDGPILMVNFMKYRDRADYGGGRDEGLSGREADDRYAPLDVLAAIGAHVVFVGDVERGSEWDRIGIVCYPSRRAFIEMQGRRDFQELHVHKLAGMDRTIVCGSLPEAAPAAPLPSGGRVVFELVTASTALQHTPSGRLRVEGTILGDGRRFASLGVAWIGEAPVDVVPSADRVVAVVAQPSIDHLAAQMSTAPVSGGAAPRGPT